MLQLLALLLAFLAVNPSSTRADVDEVLVEAGVLGVAIEVPDDVLRIQAIAAPDYAPAIRHAVEVVGRPDLEFELWRVCRRESWCGRYGVVSTHPGDHWAGKRSYRRRVAKGHLDPANCPEHRITDDRPVESFSTRGGFGQIAAGVLHLLGPCVGPEALDDPFAAAEAAIRVMDSCKRWDGPRGGRFVRSCTCPERTARWVGRGNWHRLTNKERRRSSLRQCGEQPELTDLDYLEDAWSYSVRGFRRWGFALVRHWQAWRTHPHPTRSIAIAPS